MWSHLEQKVSQDYAPPKTLKAVVAGLTRGGTVYLHNVLQTLGVNVGHECVFGTSGPTDQDFPVEVSGLIAPWAKFLKKHGVKIVHLIRDPVKCVTSNLNHTGVKWSSGPKCWRGACDLYLRWHSKLDRYADATIYLEKLPDGFREIAPMLGVKKGYNGKIAEAFEKAIKTRESKASPRHGTWYDLPDELKKYAESHGYGA